jgi:hypothetical protein
MERKSIYSISSCVGLSVATPSGTDILTFDGASRNNPEGPDRCGFAINSSGDGSTDDDTLAMGYRFSEKEPATKWNTMD